MSGEKFDDLAKKLKALANKNRLGILYHIADGESSVGQIEKVLDISQSALSQHLAVLRRENVVKTRRDAQTIYYTIEDDVIKQILAVLKTLCS